MGGIFFSSELCIADRVKFDGEKVDNDVLYLMHVNGENYCDITNLSIEPLITNVILANYKGEYAVANPKPLKSCFQQGTIPDIVTIDEARNLLKMYKSNNIEETVKTNTL